ncbi:MAG: DNA methyltransferase [Candidatus Zixiibacteriota bacterium]
MAQPQGQLFPELDKVRYGDSVRRQNLFIPRFLRKAASDHRLKGEEQDRAYQIICKWAELDESGKLESKSESQLEAEFLTDIFGKALGHLMFTENADHWELEPKYSVNGGIADAALGVFKHGTKNPPHALIELKGPKVNLDRDRFNGRTPVQQCWDYLNEQPACQWGIVSNIVSFRLYNRNQTTKTCQLFVLQDLRKTEVFEEFYYLFASGGLVPSIFHETPRADTLLRQTEQQQQEVGQILYDAYHRERVELIRHLTNKPLSKSLENAISITQKLLDRVVFIAFCEDRGLLPENLLDKAHSDIPPFAQVTNPRWRNFVNLFRSIDKGHKPSDISCYNGGLFREDMEVDNLDLEDDWTDFFRNIGKYDFRDEINVDVLGHLFEKSISDIGRLKLGGLFNEIVGDDEKRKMAKSAERKRHGIYYTPPEFTSFITYNTIGKLVEERFESLKSLFGIHGNPRTAAEADANYAAYWQKCLSILKDIKIVDPSCGSGAFLISAYDVLEEKYHEVVDQLVFHETTAPADLLDAIPNYILNDNLYGVDLSPEAVEITQLALWIRSAQIGKTLADLSQNIVCGNSLVTDPEVHPRAMEWETTFPAVFARKNAGFDCVIGNPPWERMKLQEREFFDIIEPNIAAAVSAATRRTLIAKLKKANPSLHERYENAKKTAEATLSHVRKSGRFPLTAKGDINTYATFAELAANIVSVDGRVGILVPSGIATDYTTQHFFSELLSTGRLRGLYDFENRKKIFADVDGRFKFSILLFGVGNPKLAPEFSFFSHQIEDLRNPNKRITLSNADIGLLNPNTKTCPIFRTRMDAEITKAIYKRVPVLVDKTRESGGNPWGISFLRMFDQTNDAELFHTAEQLAGQGYKRSGPIWKKGKSVFLPLYEAKMIQMYDHRAASVVVKSDNWMRQGQTAASSLTQYQNPEYFVKPRWWVESKSVTSRLSSSVSYLLGFKDITSATNQRTMIAASIPLSAVTNHFPVLLTSAGPLSEMCLLANLNSIPLDFCARQKVGAVTLNFFIVEQLPIFSPDFYNARCRWEQSTQLVTWISERVLKLSCTSNDVISLAESAGFNPPVHKWKPEERAEIMAELDAAYFILYEIEREDVEYILSTFSGINSDGGSIFESKNTTDLILKYYDDFTAKMRL